MSVCPNCKENIPDDARFCPSCGSEVKAEEPKIFCAECGAEMAAGAAFCPSCGKAVAAAENADIPQQTAEETADAAAVSEEAPKKKKKKLGCIIVPIILAVVAVLLAILIAAGGILGAFLLKPKAQDIVFYSTDDDVYVAKSGKEITSLEKARYFEWTEDYKRAFYFEGDINDDDSDMRICYIDASNPAEIHEIADDVDYNYEICFDAKGKTVLYLKDGNLYLCDVKEEKNHKIKSNVEAYDIAKNGKKFVYLTKKGELYLSEGVDDEKLISKDVVGFYHNAKSNYSEIYYLKKDSFYIYDGKKSEKIANDVEDIEVVFSSGDAYITKNEKSGQMLIDYVNDDMLDYDRSFKMPAKPTAPDLDDYYYSGYYYGSYDWDAYWDAYDRYELLYDQYIDALYEARDIEARNELREQLSETECEYAPSTLYYYNGSKLIEVTKNYDSGYSTSDKKNAISFSTIDMSKMEKIDISDIDDVSDLQYEIGEYVYDNDDGQYHIAVETTVSDVDGAAKFNEKGDTVYYTNEDDNLYKAKISDKKVKSPEIYQRNVGNFFIFGKDTVVVYEYNEDEDDDERNKLYINGEKIGENVYTFDFTEDYEEFYILSEYDSGDNSGKLLVYKNGKTVTVDTNVYGFAVNPADTLYYIKNFDIDDELCGDLYRYKNKKSEQIADEVTDMRVGYSKYREE